MTKINNPSRAPTDLRDAVEQATLRFKQIESLAACICRNAEGDPEIADALAGLEFMASVAGDRLDAAMRDAEMSA